MMSHRNRPSHGVAAGRTSPPRLERPRAGRRAAPSRAVVIRRRLVAAIALAALMAIVGVAATSGSSSPASKIAGTAAAARRSPAGTQARSGPPASQSAFSPLRRETIAQGSLPQTEAVPSAATHHFGALMAALWQGIVAGADGPALPAFFPKGAYEQLKAIDGAGSDWTNRLIHDYRLDIEAAHGLLGGRASEAQLLGVQVQASYGHWVPPGVCDNGIGYYEMPNARVIYSIGGRVGSFGIASMISWRGVWYVVHLGAILRESDTGMVDEPSAGRGSSLYSGTC